jgi:ribosome maturation factor RimP
LRGDLLLRKVTDTVAALARPIAEAAGCYLWDVEYIKEGGRWFLRIFIDRDGGVSTEHCEAVSRGLDPVLDEKDPIQDAYILEVSSAGLERSLKRPEHYESSLGKNVLVSFYIPRNGSKTLTGLLTAFDSETITLDSERINLKDIAKMNLTFCWEGSST